MRYDLSGFAKRAVCTQLAMNKKGKETSKCNVTELLVLFSSVHHCLAAYELAGYQNQSKSLVVDELPSLDVTGKLLMWVQANGGVVSMVAHCPSLPPCIIPSS